MISMGFKSLNIKKANFIQFWGDFKDPVKDPSFKTYFKASLRNSKCSKWSTERSFNNVKVIYEGFNTLR